MTDVRCTICDTLKLTGAVGWVVALDGSGRECCPRCHERIHRDDRPLPVPPLPSDPGGREDPANLRAIQRGESWKAMHEEGLVPRWPPFRKPRGA